MATLLLHHTPADPEDELFQFSGERYVYTHGGCHRFARALHTITGWQIVFWQYGDHQYVGHLGVRDPDGTYWDARGPHTNIAGFLRPFTEKPPETLEDISLEELIRRYPDLAAPDPGTERLASMMFPYLAHHPTTDRERTITFMDAVEALSRAHDVWIVASSHAPHLWPIIGEAFEGIAGYHIMKPGALFVFDRAFARDVGPEPGVRYPAHIIRFVIELTALSKKHGLWLRASFPSARPYLITLGAGDGAIAHYAIQQSLNGGGFYANLHRG